MEQGSSRPESADHLGYIDALRGYAILGVIILHTGSHVDLVDQVAWGARGVQLFFVVSALTLALSWHSRQDGAGPFFVRRLFRIVPIFWLAIAYYALTSHQSVTPWQIVTSLTFVHSLFPTTISPGLVPGGWSISDEALFYLVFPFLVATLLTTWTRSAIALAVTMWISTWWRRHGYDYVHSFGYSQQVASDFAFLFPLEQMPAFTAGFLAFHTIRNVKPGRVPYVGEAALAAGVSALLWQFHLDVHHIARVSLCLCVIVSAIGLGAGRYLVNPAIIHIGRISYSAYFVHFALLGTAEELAARYASPGAGALAVSLAFVLATTFAISTVTYATVERPLIKIGRAVIKSLLLPKARAAATA
jgi:exopolysaccharide production protein ExoZ